MKQIAFFDFDGTLIKGDSFLKFAAFAVGRMRLVSAVMLAMPMLVAWKLGIVSNSAAKLRLFGLLFRGRRRSWFDDRCESFADKLDERVRPDVMALLKEHRQLGHELVIVSASPGAWIRPWAGRYGIYRVISTEVEVIEGRLTGGFSTPNCHGREKVVRIREAIGDVDRAETWAYGDSDDDRYMLELATHSRRV